MPAPSGNPLTPVQFTGLSARVHPHRVPVEKALTASNCVTDDDAVTGRPGSRAVTSTPLAATGLFQHAGRFRPSSNCARTVEVIAGEVFIVTDASSETASDGSKHSLGTPFSPTANISGVAMNQNYYLATDEGENKGQRIVWDTLGCNDTNFALESIGGLPQGDQPTTAVSGVSWKEFKGLTFTDSGVTRSNDSATDWIICTPGSIGDSTYADLGTPIDMSTHDWLAVGVAPGNGGVQKTSVWIAQDTGGTPNFLRMGATMDITTDGVGGGPNLLYIDLTTVSPQERNAIRFIKFIGEGSTDQFAIFGLLQIPDAPVLNPETYFVTFKDMVTLEESKGTATVQRAVNTGVLPSYPHRYYDGSFVGSGADYPISDTNDRIYNRQANIGMPLASQIGQVVTVSGTAPTLAGTDPFVVRLWKLVTNGGYRLVNPPVNSTGTDTGTAQAGGASTITLRSGASSVDNFYRNSFVVIKSGTGAGQTRLISGYVGSTKVATVSVAWGTNPDNTSVYAVIVSDGTPVTSGGSYAIPDYGGSGVLANELYQAGGPMPALNCLTARDQRLVGMGIGMHANRCYISSFTPTSDTTNPVPQWPDQAYQDTDGWSLEMCPAPTEVGLVVDGKGDALYISTTEATYAMSDLTPDSLPWLVLRRGACSRHAGGYFEDRYHWASWDGIYVAEGKSDWKELTFEIRTYYQETFLPDCHACIGYNIRERALYAFRDHQYLRYAYELDRWLPGTLAFPVRQVLSWNEQGVN